MPVLPQTPAPTPSAPAVAPLVSSIPPALEANIAIGTVEKIDRVKRTFSLKTPTGTREFGFRDDTQVEIVPGLTVRLDEYVETHPSSLPFAEQERVRVKWRPSSTAGSQVATHVSPAKP